MAARTNELSNVNLGVYMERLDTYIVTQSTLNDTLCRELEKVNDGLDEIKKWRNKMYGAKSVVIFTGILFTHAVLVMSAVAGLIRLSLGV